jgi:hypothetical protein
MSSWGKNDNAANAPYWAVNSTITKSAAAVLVSAPTSDNVAILYANTTADAYITNETVGLFAVDVNEENVAAFGVGKPAHTGWVLRTAGTGGRAGRVQQEVLVALANVIGDGEDGVYQDAVVTITSQPAAVVGPVSQATADTVSLSVVAAITTGNTSAPLTYQWQVNNNSGGTWVDINPGTGVTGGQPGQMTKTGANTATLVLDPTGTSANNYVFRCIVTATGTGATATSANGRILITT